MATYLHHYFHTFQGMPTVDPDNVTVPPQDPNRQQQEARETSPPAGNNLFSQQFANHLSPGINLFSQQFASHLSKLLQQFMPLAPSQHIQEVQRNQTPGTTSQSPTGSNEVLVGRDQLTNSNSQPVDASNQVPLTSKQLPSTSNQLLGGTGEEELSEPSIIQPI